MAGKKKKGKIKTENEGSARGAGSSSSAAANGVLDAPSEISQEDYDKLVDQIRAGASTANNEKDEDGGGGGGSSSAEGEEFVWTVEACRNELLEGARYDEVDLVRAILKCRPELISHRDSKSGNTALHMAAANGHSQTVGLLLLLAAVPGSSNDSRKSLIMATNESGNTPLHWAAANGMEDVVKLLVKAEKGVDVLQKNSFGRSALSEGFQSDNTNVIQALLEHDSATEERLLETSGGKPMEDGGGGEDGEITHSLLLGRRREKNDGSGDDSGTISIKVRERVMARSDNDTILAEGADKPQDDTTGLGIWSSSLVTAQWMCCDDNIIASSKVSASPSSNQQQPSPVINADDDNNGTAAPPPSSRSVLELGAGCGLPSLALAKLLLSRQKQQHNMEAETPTRIYATDFNEETVDNLKHNIRINQLPTMTEDHQCEPEGSGDPSGNDNEGSKNNTTNNCIITAMLMNWKDESTWPAHKIDYIIGSDLIYQANMVPLLISVVAGLLNRQSERARFYYVAPDVESESGAAKRQGHDLFLKSMDKQFEIKSVTKAPSQYSQNPLESQDDEECFLHFNELQSTPYVLFEFAWKQQ